MGPSLPLLKTPSHRNKQQRQDDFIKYTLLSLSFLCIVLLLLNAKLFVWKKTDGSAAGLAPTMAPAALSAVGDAEIWAQGPPEDVEAQQQQLIAALDPADLAQLKQLCGRCLYRTLTSYVHMHEFGRFSVVLTGDIPAMWIRDSAVQMATYLPRVTRRPALRPAIEGAIRAQAFFILQDPWANAYNPQYVPPSTLPKYERQLGRGGWVWNRNFEVDSVAYFFNFLWNYHQTPSIWRPEQLLLEPTVHDAVALLLKVLLIEQHHEQLSPYRYAELPRQGRGTPSGYTGMVWSAFRPSDDPQVYGYNIPDNMYLWGSLSRLLKLNKVVWQDLEIEETVLKLLQDIHEGIQAHGVVEVDPGVRAYAYEVDGLGQSLVDFDDPNLPSLLATPLLGYELYDHSLYQTTRQRILSNSTNPFYFVGSELHGLGSPHTEPEFVWPLATAVEALTTSNSTRQLELLRMLLKMAAGNGLVHESVHVDFTTRFSRAEFGWANAMTVVMLEHLLGVDCDMEAERFRLSTVAEREAKDMYPPPNGDSDAPHYYEQLEAGIAHVSTKGPDVAVEQAPSWEQLLQSQQESVQQEELIKRVMGLPDVQQAGAVGQTQQVWGPQQNMQLGQLIKRVSELPDAQQQAGTTAAGAVGQAAAPDAELEPPQQPVVQQQQQQEEQTLSREEIQAALQLAAQQRGTTVQQLVLEEYAKALQDA